MSGLGLREDQREVEVLVTLIVAALPPQQVVPSLASQLPQDLC
jgi:hypothetical protein